MVADVEEGGVLGDLDRSLGARLLGRNVPKRASRQQWLRVSSFFVVAFSVLNIKNLIDILLFVLSTLFLF